MPRLRAWCQLAAVTCALVAGSVTPPVTAVAGTGQPNWGVQSPAQSPPVREFEGMAYDSGRGRTVMFSGGNGTFGTNPLDDTWEWDGASWTQFATVPAPPSVIGPGMAYDSKRGVTVLLDNSSHTWEWNGAQWTQRVTATSPPARVWASMAYDAIRGVMVLFGGDSLGQTWTYDGNNWTRMTPGASPSPRTGTAMAFDSGRGVVVLFGGRDPVSGQRLNDTWEWDGTNWTQRSPASSPFARSWHTMAYDAQAGATVMFGGDHIQPYSLGPINDTWLWDGTNWTQDWTFAAPSARSGQAMAYQSANGSIVMFGGSDGLNPGKYPTDTWELGPAFTTPTGNPALTFTTNTLGLNVNAIGATATTSQLFVESSGTGPLLISSLTMPPGFAVASSTCPVPPNPLAAGMFCRFAFSFTAAACGTETGFLTFIDNGPGGSQSINVEGGVLSATCDADLLVSPPQDVTVASTSTAGAIVNFSGPGTNEIGATASCTPSSGSVFPIGVTAVTCQATDSDDVTSTVNATFHVTVTPEGDLALTKVPADIGVPLVGPSGTVVTYAAPTVVDEDATLPAVTCTPASGSTFPAGTTTVTCTASDADDTPSAVSATFHVTVNDSDLAFASAPPDGVVNATSPAGAVVNYSILPPTDEDATAPNPACTPASGTTFAIGTTTVTCTAFDADDTPSTVTTGFHVTVRDTDLAVTGLPATIVVVAFTSAGTAVTYTLPGAVDEEGAPVVTCDHASGSTFAIGVTTVTCSAFDADDSPSIATASFTVIVRDTDLGLSVPGNITAVAASAAGAAVSYAAPVVTDEEGAPAVTCDHASGSVFSIGVTQVVCSVTDADDTPSFVTLSFFVTVIPDTSLAISVSPSAATAHATVTTTASVTDIGAVTRKVSIAYTVTFTDPSGLVTTVAADRATVTVAPGATVSRSFFLPIKNNTAPGSYVVTVTSSDETGSVTQTATFTVS